MVKYVPERADVVWLECDPQAGREINKTRPALVISPAAYNAKSNLALFMPITSQIKGYPFETIIHTKEITGVILCDQIRSLDWSARNVKKITQLPEKIFLEALSRLELLLD